MTHPYFYHHEPSHNPHEHPDVLDVILVVSNTPMYETRYRLFRHVFEQLKKTPHVRVTVAEMAFGERPFHFALPDTTNHVLLRSNQELWHKENLINQAIQRLPEGWKYACWMDADISFTKSETWAKETIEKLQHHMVVQPWSHAVDLSPEHEAIGEVNKGSIYTSFTWCYQTGKKMRPTWKYYGADPQECYPHSGYAWAARREFFTHVGQLLDFAICGAGDHHMAWAMIGESGRTIPGTPGTLLNYRKQIEEWEDRCRVYLKRNIGFVPGMIYHYFHGKKRDRQYSTRWKVLVDNDFNPATDLYYDWQGVLRLRVENERQVRLRDSLARYMHSRNEDSRDID